jgi:ABC-type amino acid transport substrate-binding protein
MRTLFLLILLGFFSVHAKDTLRVAINPIEPFVMSTTDGDYEGYDIDLIEKVAIVAFIIGVMVGVMINMVFM